MGKLNYEWHSSSEFLGPVQQFSAVLPDPNQGTTQPPMQKSGDLSIQSRVTDVNAISWMEVGMKRPRAQLAIGPHLTCPEALSQSSAAEADLFVSKHILLCIGLLFL